MTTSHHLEPALAAHLSEYLQYMQSLGFRGLAIPHSPFSRSAQAAPAAAPAATKAAPAPKAVPKPAATAKPQAKPKQQIPNVMSIMEMVEDALPKDDVAQKVAAIEVSDQVEALRQLYGTFKHCQACALGTTRQRFVFGEGPPAAPLMFVGEGPGRDEDRSGRPFVGSAGQLLDKIIEAMGFRRADVFITNVVKCRPPENRTPLPDETATCSPILAKQIQVVKPQAIVALGATALRFFHGADAPLTRMRGNFFQWEGIAVMPTFHPAYILRNPRAKRDVWNDMQKVMTHLKKK